MSFRMSAARRNYSLDQDGVMAARAKKLIRQAFAGFAWSFSRAYKIHKNS
jgi:hypothetical protein